MRAAIRKNRHAIRSVAALFGSNITSSVLTAIAGLMVALFLGPTEIGTFRAFTIPLTYLMVMHLGTFDGLWRQIPYYLGKKMPEQVDKLASAAGAYNLLLSAVVSCGFVCCAISALFCDDLYSFFGWISQAIVSWEVFYGGYLISTYRTLNHFVALSKIKVTQTVLSFGMVFLLPVFQFYGLCVRAAFPSIVAVWLFYRDRPLVVTYRFDSTALSELIKIGFPFSFWGSLYSNVWIATESALVLSLAGVHDLGLFSVAYALRAAMSALPMAVWHVLTPRIITSVARDGIAGKANGRMMWATAGLTGFMILLSCLASFLLDIFVPLIIQNYVEGIPVMKVCLWFSVVQAAHIPITLLFAAGRQWLFGRGVIVGAVVFALTTFLLLPVIGGLLAVAVGSLFGRISRTLVGYVDVIALIQKAK